MQNGNQLSLVGMFLAALTFVILLVAGTQLAIAIGVLILWIGSLVLASSKPPEMATRKTPRPFTSANMKGLIERASTPLLVMEHGKIAQANRTARKLLGKHIIGQDPRLVFRQPEAIALMGKGRNGSAIAHGLVRRRDIWQINLQSIESGLAVLELINKTGEADIGRAHTDFVANASHELRTPLASIIGYAETLSERGEKLDAPIAQKFVDTIRREAARMQSLVSDLMSLSRVEAEKHDEPGDVLNLSAVVERAARDAAGPEWLERLVLVIEKDLSVKGDTQQIEQLVRNLVDNALKYGAEGKPVVVELDEGREHNARLSVIDQGEGIAPEHLPHLTRRFYRTDPGRSRASGGTGLGLAIVKHIVERHRGRLDIESKLGKGTTVIIRIPLAEKAAAKVEPKTMDAERTGQANKDASVDASPKKAEKV
jgi:two-component system phosphate regulon sensor histidine kinase PhoR